MLFTQLVATLALVSTTFAKPLFERAYSVDLQNAAHEVYNSWFGLESAVNNFQPTTGTVEGVEVVINNLDQVAGSFNILNTIITKNGVLNGDEVDRFMWNFKDAGPHSYFALTSLAGKRAQIELLDKALVANVSQSFNNLDGTYLTFEERLLSSGVPQAKIDEYERSYQVKNSLEAAQRAFL